MRKALCAFALALAFACPALAREIHNPPPQPPPEEATTEREILTPPLAEVLLTLFALL